jgi:hypothetical protein
MTKPIIALFLFILFSPALAYEQYNYKLVNIIKIETKDFVRSKNESAVYAKIPFPDCEKNGRPDIDIGDYLLGPDCFMGDAQYIEVKKDEHQWRIQLPYCYSSHLYSFVRNIKIFCKYPLTT